MHTDPKITVQSKELTAHHALDKLVPVLFAAALGIVLIFAGGFAQTHVLHNAAHDARHAAGFPCH